MTDDRVPLTMISRHGKQARFAAVLEPVSDTQPPPTVTSVRIMERDGAVRIEVRQGSETDTLLLDDRDKVQLLRNDKLLLKNISKCTNNLM